MKVLIITGELAYPLIKEVVSSSKEDIIVHIADNTQVAAFLTPRQIIKEVKNCFSDQLDEIDMILVPGLIKKGTKEITKELGIPTFKGSTDGADLAMVLNLIGSIDLSEDKPADKLIEEEKRKEAFKFIEEFENDEENIKKLLEKPNNILIRNLPVGEDFPMRVLSEIANAPFLSKEALINKCQYFVDSGLLCHLLRIESVEELILHPNKGAIVETFALAELLKSRLNQGKQPNLTYYRDQKGFEVDTIADWKHTFAIEIKSTIEAEQSLSKNTRDYLALRGNDGTRGAVFYLGDLTCTINGIDYVSWKDWGTYQ